MGLDNEPKVKIIIPVLQLNDKFEENSHNISCDLQ